MIDKRLLTDSVKVELVESKDEWGDKKHSTPITLNNVRFDRTTQIKNNQNLGKNTLKNKVGTIFIYPKITEIVIDDSWIGAKVTDEYGEYKVQGYSVNKLNGQLFSIELEVI